MKVLLATCMVIPHTGGASTHFELLSKSLSQAGLLGGQIVGQDCLPSRIRRLVCGVRALGRKDPRRLGLLRETVHLLTDAFNRQAASGSLSVIHCHDALATFAAVNSPVVKERAIPVVQTVHGPWSRESLTAGVGADSLFYRELRQIEHSAFAKCTRFIAVDRGQAEILSADFGVHCERISVIHNAVDYAEISALSRVPNPKRIPKPYFVVPRRLVPKNGVHVAIEALTHLDNRNIHLAIAGDGHLADDLRRQAEASNLTDRVHFLGNLSREALLPLMAESVGVVVPSVPCEGVVEATSLSVIESFACRVPVVASNIGGLGELIQHATTGLLFPAADAALLAENMLRLFEMSYSDRNTLCNQAALAALAKWDVGPWFGFTTDAYETALNSVTAGRYQ